MNLSSSSNINKIALTNASLPAASQNQSSKPIHRLSGTLNNGFEDQLSIRPSPSRQIPVAKSRSPVIVNLDSESEKEVLKQVRKPSVLHRDHSPDLPVIDLSLSDWIKPEIKPIRFDPNFESSKPDKFSCLSPVNKNTTDLPKSHTSSSASLFRGLPQSTKRADGPSKPLSTPSNPQIPKVPVVIVPPTEAQLLRRIKDDIGYIRTNPRNVENGLGVRRFDDADLNAAIFEKAKQKRRKNAVDRESLSLGLDYAEPSKKTKDSTIVEPRSAVRHVLLERFKPHSHEAPLTFKNRIDERCLDGKFQFVSQYILRKGVMKRRPAPLPYRACRCVPTELCQGICSCATVQAKEAGKDLKIIPGIRPYKRNARGTIVLTQSILDLSSYPVIYECTDKCSCGPSCTNKVVQKGRTLPLQIFETGRCGFGVKAMEDIAKGQFIDLYLGEVLTTGELQKRENAAAEDTPSYVMSLDMFVTDEKALFHVDGANFGSLTRFVNHSCEPNAKTIPVVLSEDTRHIYHVGFFAIKEIPKGSEITIDYNPDLKGQPIEQGTEDSAIVQCKCGTASCRKRLWMPGTEKRARRRYLPDLDDD